MSYDVLVIGGGPAGLSAAVNARARGRSVLVVSNPLEENPLWKAEKVDNHLGMPGMTGAEMLKAFCRHAEEAGVEFRSGKVLTEVVEEDGVFAARMELRDENSRLISIELAAPDKKQARKLAAAFHKCAEQIYSAVLDDLLMETDDD